MDLGAAVNIFSSYSISLRCLKRNILHKLLIYFSFVAANAGEY